MAYVLRGRLWGWWLGGGDGGWIPRCLGEEEPGLLRLKDREAGGSIQAWLESRVLRFRQPEGRDRRRREEDSRRTPGSGVGDWMDVVSQLRRQGHREGWE